MTWVRLPKTKKSYHSKVAPSEEAATTVRRLAAFSGAAAPSEASSAIDLVSS